MSWTAPRTWTDGEIVTRVIFDAHVRDNMKYLKGDGEVIVLEDDVRWDGQRTKINPCPFQINYWNGSSAEDQIKITRDGANDYHLWLKYSGAWEEIYNDGNWTGGHTHSIGSDATAGGALELTTSWQSATGLSVTCGTAGQWLLIGNATILNDYPGDGIVQVAIYNSSDATYGQSSYLYGSAADIEMSVPVVHTEDIAASKNYTIRARLLTENSPPGTSYLRIGSGKTHLGAAFLGASS